MVKNKSLFNFVFLGQIILFILLLGFFLVSLVYDVGRNIFGIMGIIALAFLILGIWLIILAVRQKLDKKLKIFLILMGASSSLVLVSVILHNFFYALAIVFKDMVILKAIMEFLYVSFFLMGLLVCPILFLVGVIGSIILIYKKV